MTAGVTSTPRMSGVGERPEWWRGGVELARLHQKGWVGFTTRKGEGLWQRSAS